MEPIENTTIDAGELRALVRDHRLLGRLERLAGGFNLFETLKLTHQEIRHSNVLSWLLDPDENHGLGDAFLRAWLMQVVEESGTAELDVVAVHTAEFRNVAIRREWRHIDILVELSTSAGQWVIVVENKILSEQHSNQLERYREVVEQEFPNARRIYILLSAGEDEPEDSAYVPVRYETVYRAINECLDDEELHLAPGPRLLIEQYQNLIHHHLMEDTEIQHLARDIYRKHRRALDLIIEHRPDAGSELTEALKTRLEEGSEEWKGKYRGHRKGAIWLVPDELELDENLAPNGHRFWLELYFYYMDKPSLCLKVGGGSEGWRSLVVEQAREGEWPGARAIKKIPAGDFTLSKFDAPGIRLEGLEVEDVEETASEIWRFFCADRSSDAMSVLLGRVREFLLKQPQDPE